MTKIFLIRHGEAEGNVYRRAQGQTDGRITAKGLRQIADLAERLRNEHITALYSSDLRRTVETARAVTKYHDLDIQTDPRLREVHLGAWEDVPFGNLSCDHPRDMINFNDDPDNWRAEGAEDYVSAVSRVYAAIEEKARNNEGRTIAIVSHGMVIRGFLCRVLGIASEDIRILPHGDNTAVSLLEYEGGAFRVVYSNDNSHLADGNSTFARQTWWKDSDGADSGNLRFLPLDPHSEGETLLAFYEKSLPHLAENDPRAMLERARLRRDDRGDAIIKAISGDDIVGITELDGESESIVFCYVEPRCRRCQLGVQLLGHGVSVFRKMGKSRIAARIPESNTAAMAFYREYGFKETAAENGAVIMTKEL